MKARWIGAGVLLVAALTWAACARAGFFWDDWILVVNNPVLEDFHLRRLLTDDLFAADAARVGRHSPYFRPLMTLSLALDHRLFGLEPAGYHLHNLAWHLAAIAALFGLALPRLGAGRAAVAALVFGLHPVQSEAVVWVAARNDLLCATFSLLALAAFDRRRDALGALAVLAACCAKEAGVLAPALLVAWRLAFAERPRARELAAASVATALYLGLRANAQVGSVVAAPIDLEILLTVPGKLVSTYLGWLAWPWPLTGTASVYQAPPSIAAWGAATATLALLFAAVRTAPRRGLALVGCALLVWAPTLLSTAVTHGFGERFLYLSIGFLAVLGAGAVPATRAWAVGGTLALVASVAVVQLRLPDWQDEGRLWEQAEARAPDPYSAARLGGWREGNGDLPGAFRAWHDALTREPLLRPGCADPVRLLVDVGAMAPAVVLSDALVARGCTVANFKGWRFKALVGAGNIATARGEVPPPPWRIDEVPFVAALCLAVGDDTCAQELALGWPRGPADLRARIFDVLGG